MRMRHWHTTVVCLIIGAVLLGICFRFGALDRKLYWGDEVFTSLRLSGHTEAELVQDFNTAGIVSIRHFDRYQQADPAASGQGTIAGLATEEPQIAPLYYVLARAWAMQFGSAVATLRGFSALLSLLVFPSLYWLCWELFASPLTAGLAIALVAVSPIQVLFAQEARHYSLWTVTTLLTSAALLWAMRCKTPLAWGLYTLASILSLYTNLLSMLVTIGQGIYLAAIVRRLSKPIVHFLIAVGISGLALLPWIVQVLRNWSQVRHTLRMSGPPTSVKGELARAWFRQPSRLFFDLNPDASDPVFSRITQVCLTTIGVALVIYALYFLYRTTPQRVWLFVFSLIGSTLLVLLMQDVSLKGQNSGASATPRYIIPYFLGLHLAIAHLISHSLVATTVRQRRIGQAVCGLVLVLSVISCGQSARSQVWWNKGERTALQNSLTVAHMINDSRTPVLITDAPTRELAFYYRLLEPKVQVLAALKCSTCQQEARSLNPDLATLSRQFSDLFLFPAASSTLIQTVEQQGYRLELAPIVPMGGPFNRIKPG